MIEPLRDVSILTGPTGSGKTRLAMELARRLDAEIVSMDSMAPYRGMDIGTAKPSAADRKLIPHHLVDVLEPWESASVAWWLEQARSCCEDIRRRRRKILFVGGTPLYLKALLRGLFDGPSGDQAIRQRHRLEAQEHGSAFLHARLAQADPVAAKRIHPNDLRRISRALEVLELTGRPMSHWQQEWQTGTAEFDGGDRPPTRRPSPLALWLDISRPELYARIDQRVHEMFAAGFVDEVQSLRNLPRPLSREAGQAVGYREVLNHLEGNASLEDTIRAIQQRTRNFAKRQVTWFRHLPEVMPATKELTEALWCLKMR